MKSRMTIFLLLITFMFCLTQAHAYTYDVTLAWEASPTSEAITGYKLYTKTGTGQYTTPKYTGALPYATVNLTCNDGQECKTSFVVRAYRGTLESGNSNEVSYTFDGVKPANIAGFAVTYNAVNNQVTFNWNAITLAQKQKISKWVFYYKDLDTTLPKVEVASLIPSATTIETTYNTPITLPAKKNNLQFTMVAFNKSGIPSNDSTAVNLVIDLLPISTINTLRIDVVTTLP